MRKTAPFLLYHYNIHITEKIYIMALFKRRFNDINKLYKHKKISLNEKLWISSVLSDYHIAPICTLIHVPFVSQDPGGASFVLLGPGTGNRPRRIYKIEPRFRHWHNHV